MTTLKEELSSAVAMSPLYGKTVLLLNTSSIGRLFSNHYDANEVGGHRKVGRASAGLGKGRRRDSAVGSRRSRKVIKYSKTSQLK